MTDEGFNSGMYLRRGEGDKPDIIEVVLGGKIGVGIGTNYSKRVVGVDISELDEIANIGDDVFGKPKKAGTPEIRILANKKESILVCLRAFAKAYVVQEAMEDPNLTVESLNLILKNRYDVSINKI